MTTSTLPLGITIPLSIELHETARQWAGEQINNSKGKRVYLNTLAVGALHTYLNWLGITSDLEASYSQHPLERAAFDRADLYIPELGRIDCIVALPGEDRAESPLRAEDAIAQVLVQFPESLSSVCLAGYSLSMQEEVSTDAEQNWFPIEQLAETLIRWQMCLDYLDNSEDEKIQNLQKLIDNGVLNNSQAITVLMANWETPYLLRIDLQSRLRTEPSRAGISMANLSSASGGKNQDTTLLDQLEAGLEALLEAIKNDLNF